MATDIEKKVRKHKWLIAGVLTGAIAYYYSKQNAPPTSGVATTDTTAVQSSDPAVARLTGIYKATHPVGTWG